MFKIDDSQIKDLENQLSIFKNTALPFATKQTLNKTVFEGQKIARRDVQVKMIQRNKFTVQSIQVDQAKGLNISTQAAVLGSIAPYMDEQEFGAVERKTGKVGVAIPTGYAAGQEGAGIRTKLPRKGNALANIQLQKRAKQGVNKRQRNLMAIQQAVKTGNRFVFLDLVRSKGIFKVVGGRYTGKGWPIGARLKMVYDMSKSSVTIPKTPWLLPAVKHVENKLPQFYAEALEFQLKKHGLFRQK